MLVEQEAELPYHIPTAFKVGDKLKVVAVVKEAHAWHYDWLAPADRMVTGDSEVVVRSADNLLGFLVDGKNNSAWVPSCALAERPKPVQKVVIIEVPSVELGSLGLIRESK